LAAVVWGSARVSRVGERVLAIANFSYDFPTTTGETLAKTISAWRRNQPARRVRYPETR